MSVLDMTSGNEAPDLELGRVWSYYFIAITLQIFSDLEW